MDGLVSSMKSAMPDLEKVVGTATNTILGLDAKPKVNLQANGRGSAGAGAQVVNNYHVEITGKVIDEYGAAQAIERLLSKNARQRGRSIGAVV